MTSSRLGRYATYAALTALGLFIVVMLAGAGIVLYLQSPAGLAFVQTRLNAAIPGRIEIEHWEWGLFRGTLALHNTSLFTPDGQPAITFSSLQVALAWAPLLQRTLAIKHIILADPRITLIQTPDGDFSITRVFLDPAPSDPDTPPRPKSAEPASLPLDIQLQHLRIQNGQLTYQAPDRQVIVQLAEVDLSAALQLAAGTAQADLSIGQGLVQAPDLHIPIEHFQFRAALQDDILDGIGIELATAFAGVNITGTVHNVRHKPDMMLKAALTADLDAAREYLPEQLSPLAGRLDLNIDLQGPLDDPHARVVLAHHGAPVANPPVAIEGLDLVLELAARRLRLEPLLVRVPDGHLRLTAEADLQAVFPQGFLLSGAPDWAQVGYVALLETDLRDLTQLGIPDLEGAIQGEWNLEGRGIDLATAVGRMGLTLDAVNFRAHAAVETVAFDLALQASATAEQVDLQTLTVNTRGLAAQAAGSYDRSAGTIRAQLQAAAPDLQHSLAPFGITDAYGHLDLHVNVQGNLKQPDVDLQMDGRQLQWAKFRLGDLGLKARLDPAGQVHVTRLTLVNQGSRISAEGSLQLLQPDSFSLNTDLPLAFRLDIRDLELNHFVEKSLAEGRIAGHIVLEQAGGRMRGEADLRAGAIRIADWTVGDLGFTTSLADGVVTIESLVLQNGKSRLQGQGRVHLFAAAGLQLLDDPQFVFDLDSAATYIEDFYDAMRGRIALTAALQGSLTDPSASLRLDLYDLDTGYQLIPRAWLQADFEDRTINLEELLIELAVNEHIHGSGWYALDQRFALSLQTTALNLNSIDQIAAHKLAEGSFRLNADGRGTVADPRLTANLELNNLVIDGQALDNLAFSLTLADQQVTLQGAPPLALQARYHLQSRNMDALLAFDNWNMAPVFDLLQQPDFDGMLNGRVQARGNLGAWQKIEADVDISGLELRFKESLLLTTNRLQARMQNQQITLAPVDLTVLSTGHLNVAGAIDLSGGSSEPLSVTLDAAIPLAVAEGFRTDIMNIEGDLLARARIGGTLEAPVVDAQIEVQDAAMLLTATGQPVHDLNILVQLTPEALTIERAEGYLADGRFGLSGNLALSAWQPSAIDMRLSAAALPLTVTRMLDLTLNIDVALQGTPDSSRLSGDVLLLEGLYYQDVNLYPIGDLLSRRREVSPAARELPEIPFLQNLALDVDIKRRNPLRVDNNVARLDINPDLNIGGRLSQPVISGRAEVASGNVFFQKKTFTIVRGVVDFVDPYRIDPVVDIQSQTRVRQYEITLTLTGPVSHLRFQLTSTPHEEDGDIISLLLFGSTTRELARGDGGSTQSAGMMLAELVAATFGDDLRDAAGLDILILETGEGGGPDSSDRVQVTMGKELSRRMTVKYAIASQKEGTVQRIITEYRFFENILLSAFQDSQGSFGGELQFRMEFR